jgi:hypothetical protein
MKSSDPKTEYQIPLSSLNTRGFSRTSTNGDIMSQKPNNKFDQSKRFKLTRKQDPQQQKGSSRQPVLHPEM